MAPRLWRLDHVDANPRHSTTATYSAAVDWPTGRRTELLGASARRGRPERNDERAINLRRRRPRGGRLAVPGRPRSARPATMPLVPDGLKLACSTSTASIDHQLSGRGRRLGDDQLPTAAACRVEGRDQTSSGPQDLLRQGLAGIGRTRRPCSVTNCCGRLDFRRPSSRLRRPTSSWSSTRFPVGR